MKHPFVSLLNRLSKQHKTESNRHAKRSWKKMHPTFSLSKSVLAVSLLFLFLPLFIIAFFSFNASKEPVFTEFSFVWYEQLRYNSMPLISSLMKSISIAFNAGVTATLFGTLAAIGVNLYKFKGRTFIQTISFLPMVLPEVTMGISMLVFFSAVKQPLGMTTIYIAHTTFCIPFVFLLVSARIDEFDYSMIEASHDLGANDFQTLMKVIVPSIAPGVISGFLMSVTISLEDYVITSLVSGPGSTTLPIYVYSMIRFGVSPVINALSVVLMTTICLIAFLLRKNLKSFAASH